MDTEIKAPNSNIRDAIEAGKEAVEVERRVYHVDDFDDVPIAIRRNGDVVVLHDVLRVHDERAERPRRRKGTAKLTELESFLAHVERNKLNDSVIFADKQRLTAVYNYNPPGTGTAWGDHRAEYSCPLSDEWQAWAGKAGQWLTQEQLSRLFDECFGDLVDYPGNKAQGIPPCTRLDLVGLADYLEIHSSGAFKKSRRAGKTELSCTSEQTEGSTMIPQRFGLLLPVFVGGKAYPIEARLELHIKDSEPLFKYDLLKAAAVKREAFADVRAAVAEKTGLPVFAGSPEV